MLKKVGSKILFVNMQNLADLSKKEESLMTQ